MKTDRQKPIIAITGAIGSGKTTAAKILQQLGCAVIEADKLNHEILQRPDIQIELTKWWGTKMVGPDGLIDRKEVANAVFGDRQRLQKLTNLLHPLILERQEALISQYQADPSVKAVVLDIPLLFEVGWKKMCDSVIFVDCDDKTRLNRVKKTRGWDEENVKKREKFNLSLDIKAKMSDYIVANRSSIPDLADKLVEVLSQVLES